MKNKNLLVTGASGFIGSNFLKYVLGRKLDVNLIAPRHKDLDILDRKQLKSFFDDYNFDAIINFAAHRDANSAERQRSDHKGTAWQTNVLGLQNLNDFSKKHSAFLIHISTDMVFSGSEDNKGPYHEKSRPEMQPDHLSWYGWTKVKGEEILDNQSDTAIIRIGNVTHEVYDPKTDYVGKILYLFDRNKLYPLFHDQYLTLSYLPTIFEAIEKILSEKAAGIYHVTSTNVFTPYDLGVYLIKKARGKAHSVKKLSIHMYLKKSPNRYPRYGGLAGTRTNKTLHLKPLSWEEIVDRYIASIKST